MARGIASLRQARRRCPSAQRTQTKARETDSMAAKKKARRAAPRKVKKAKATKAKRKVVRKAKVAKVKRKVVRKAKVAKAKRKVVRKAKVAKARKSATSRRVAAVEAAARKAPTRTRAAVKKAVRELPPSAQTGDEEGREATSRRPRRTSRRPSRSRRSRRSKTASQAGSMVERGAGVGREAGDVDVRPGQGPRQQGQRDGAERRRQPGAGREVLTSLIPGAPSRYGGRELARAAVAASGARGNRIRDGMTRT